MQLISFAELNPGNLSRAREIYEASFPAWEREDFAQLLGRGAHDGGIQLACTVDRQVIGIATLSALRSVGWDFLEYFALRQDRRGQGLGSEFWGLVRARLDRPVVIEVEHPEQPGISADEAAVREGRIRFWLRMGFTGLPVPNYRVPRADGGGDFERLLVMSTVMPEPPLCSLESLIAALYAEGYGLREPHRLAAVALGGQEHV